MKIEGGTYFFTLVTHGRQPILIHESNVHLLRSSFRHVMAKHPFVIDAIVVLPDHLHCIWTLPKGDSDFSTRWRLIKSTFSRGCGYPNEEAATARRIRKKERAIWQKRFWEHVIRDDRDFKTHVNYIHYNPVKHGLVKSPGEWPYSSFHRYVRRGILKLDWGADADIEFPRTVGSE